MERMDSRLANIERLLQGMSSSGTIITSTRTPQTLTSTALEDFISETDSNGQYQLGEVGLSAQSAATKHAIDQTVSRDAALQRDTRLENALEALRRIVARVQQDVEERPTDFPWARHAVQAAPTWKRVRPVLERYMGPFFRCL